MAGISTTTALNVTSAREEAKLVPMMDLFKSSSVLYRSPPTALMIEGAPSVERKNWINKPAEKKRSTFKKVDQVKRILEEESGPRKEEAKVWRKVSDILEKRNSERRRPEVIIISERSEGILTRVKANVELTKLGDNLSSICSVDAYLPCCCKIAQ